MKEIKPKTFYELYNQHRTMLEPQLPNVSHEKVPSLIEQDWDAFFNKQLGENNINTQVKLPTTKDIEDKNKEIEFLQNQIENLNLQLEDAALNYCRLQDKYDNLTAQYNNLQLKLVIETNKLKDELDTTEKNRKHVTDMFEQKDAVLTEAMKVVNQLRNKIVQDDTDKINAEHLAKKCLQLTDELTKLKEQLTTKDLLIISSKKKLDEIEKTLSVSRFKCENIEKSYEENQNLVKQLNKYVFDKNIVIEQLVNDLIKITKSGLFSRKDVATKAIKNYENFIIKQNKS